MRLLRLLALPLILLLAVTGAGCTEDEPYVRVLPPVDEPPFDYALYCDARGQLVGEDSAVLLVRRPSHLEHVYAETEHGEPRAQALFQQLEDTFRDSGLRIAEEVTSPRCLALPMPGCKPDWSFLDRLLPSHGPGAQHLREVLATAFEQRARERGLRNALLTSALNVLLAGSVVKGPLKGVAAEGSAAGRELLAATERHAAVAATSEAEALEARLMEAEAVSTEARHPAALTELARFRPSLESPPTGTAPGDTLWRNYVSYWERRYAELAEQRPPPPAQEPPKPPLLWKGYREMHSTVQRGVEFQRSFHQFLRQELELSETARRLLRGMKKPLLAENVGLRRAGGTAITFTDQLVVDEATLQPGNKVRVETFSNKSHDFRGMTPDEIVEQAVADAREARTKYGGTVQIRRPGHPLFGKEVIVSKVHLVYDSETLTPSLRTRLTREFAARKVGVELHFHQVLP